MNFEHPMLAWAEQADRSKTSELMFSSLEPTPLPIREHGTTVASNHLVADKTFSSTTMNHHQFDDVCPLETLSFVDPITPELVHSDLKTIFDAVSSECGVSNYGNSKPAFFDMELNHLKIEQLRAAQHLGFSPEPPTLYEKRPSFSTVSSSKRWKERYNDLVEYKRRFGDCCVPPQWIENGPLAQWVKRQRYQVSR